MNNNEIGALELRKDGSKDTVWANLEQISMLFGRYKSMISRHIKNIFKGEELARNSTVPTIAIFATAKKEGKRNVGRRIEYFHCILSLRIILLMMEISVEGLLVLFGSYKKQVIHFKTAYHPKN